MYASYCSFKSLFYNPYPDVHFDAWRLLQMVLVTSLIAQANAFTNALQSRWLSGVAHYSIVMLQAAADHLEQRIGQYNPQNVCNILWTYATLGYYPGGSPLDVAADYALHALEVSSHCCGVVPM